MTKRILVPLDRETEHEAILPLVADIARGGGATVGRLHVAPMPDNIVNDDGRVIAYVGQEMQRLEVEWRDWLLPAEATLPPLAVQHAVRFGEPVEQILAERRPAAAPCGAPCSAASPTSSCGGRRRRCCSSVRRSGEVAA
jgi:hypothetical protein